MKPISEFESKISLCPSAQPEMEGSFAFGIVGGSAEQPAVKYLTQPQPANEVIELVSTVRPTEVFRFAATCEAQSCQHFDGHSCRLAMRVVDKLPIVAESLPPCTVRSNCRWWQQEGKAACLRCPQVVTELYQPSKLQVEVAVPVMV